ncbi:MAG TPA: choice-of-anchor V domain-containing protein, partial [Candidatus Poseidoniales archaeon]|nr:choice-of-anchor V domain-containing protein [Candidatus Poseidoniales archaeon]
MERPEMKSRKFLLASFILVAGLALVPQFTAYPTGVADNAVSGSGCYCHVPGDDGTISPSIEGIPESYETGTTYRLNISITGDNPLADNPENQGGFLLQVSSGSLESVDNTTGRNYGPGGAGEYSGTNLITHSEAGNDQRSWTVDWVAPDTAGENIEFTVWVNAVNGASGNGGDKYGGASEYIGSPTAAPLVVLLTAVLLALTLVIGAAIFVTAQINPGALSWNTIGPWLKGWLTTTDHKGIGTLYIVFGLTFFVVGGILALLFR